MLSILVCSASIRFRALRELSGKKAPKKPNSDTYQFLTDLTLKKNYFCSTFYNLLIINELTIAFFIHAVFILWSHLHFLARFSAKGVS